MTFNTWTGEITTPTVSLACGECGLVFAVPQKWYDEHSENRMGFYCPNGHARVFNGTGETATERKLRLRAELAERDKRYAEERAGRLHGSNIALGRKLSAAKGQATKLRKRIGNGVCPCRNRHFTNVERHMTTQHPEWKEGGDV